MSAYRPTTLLDTHEVLNQPPPLEDIDLFATDRALVDAVARAGGAGMPRGSPPSARARDRPRRPAGAPTPTATYPSSIRTTATAAGLTRCASIPPITS